MAVNCSFPYLCLLIFIRLFVFPFVEGFHVDLIHRDSPKSPYHNPSNSRFESLHNAFGRSFERAAYLKAKIVNSKQKSDVSAQVIQSVITPSSGEYLMEASIGTPPFNILAIADTGSDLTWTQCDPCTNCYQQNAPLFDSRRSRTYRQVSCEASQCANAGQSSCDSENNCQYQYSYGDRSYTIGDLATETLTFASDSGDNVSIPRVIFGCGRQNAGTFSANGSGIIGLGGGQLSIVTQLREYVNGRFSYCLIPIDQSGSGSSSKINFGSTAVVSGRGTVSTPLIKKIPDTFYYLTIEGVSVKNSNSVPKSSVHPTQVDTGNIIIDSGTTLTFLPTQIYNDLEAILRETISGTMVSDPQGLFGLCYQAGKGTEFPDLVAHFTGADVLLSSANVFLQVSDQEICLTIVPNDELAIFGNLSQVNYKIGYDLVNERVSFQPTDCTKN